MLSAGAFSDDAVVTASKDVVCVFIDLEWGRKHVDLAERYDIKAFPTVIYADSDGEEIGRMQTFDESVIAREIASLARDHSKKLH